MWKWWNFVHAGFAAVSEACVGCKQYWQQPGHGVKCRCWDASLLRFCRAFRHGGSCAALACPMSLSAVAYLEWVLVNSISALCVVEGVMARQSMREEIPIAKLRSFQHEGHGCEHTNQEQKTVPKCQCCMTSK